MITFNKIFLLGPGIIIMMSSCVSSSEIDNREVQAVYFKNTFELELPEEVEEVQIKDHFVIDSWMLFIRFSHDEQFHKEIVAKNFSLTVDSIPEDVLDNARGNVFKGFGSKPDWFKIPPKATKVYFGKAEHLAPGNWSIISEAYWISGDTVSYYIASATHY
jgi:hypothetical protein